MGVNLKQDADGGLGFEGTAAGKGSITLGVINYNVPVATTAQLLFNAVRPMVIDAVVGRTFVAGTGGAATAALFIAASGTAPASGTAVHSGTFNLVGTIHTDQTLTLTNVRVPAGSAVWVVYTGTATSAIGGIAVMGRPT
ncbi:MAG: hypothetical protein V4605_09565 [Pseudomonadota bacterium]